jgi:hypothetical protein
VAPCKSPRNEGLSGNDRFPQNPHPVTISSADDKSRHPCVNGQAVFDIRFIRPPFK